MYASIAVFKCVYIVVVMYSLCGGLKGSGCEVYVADYTCMTAKLCIAVGWDQL